VAAAPPGGDRPLIHGSPVDVNSTSPRSKRAPLAERVARLAREALEEEPRVWPRLGLVGPQDTGSHRDMEFGHFQASAGALEPYFADLVRLGIARGVESAARVRRARELGVRAESRMLAATGGRNTHKGAVFLLGTFVLSWATLFGERARRGNGDGDGKRNGDGDGKRNRDGNGDGNSNGIGNGDGDGDGDGKRNRDGNGVSIGAALHRARSSFGPALRRDLDDLGAGDSYGAWAYRRHGHLGARGLVLHGFAPLLRVWRYTSFLDRVRPGESARSLGGARLLAAALSDDTNLVKRAGLAARERLRGDAYTLWRRGGPLDPRNHRDIERLDSDVVRRGLSASASGDLTAIVLLFRKMCDEGLAAP